VQAGFACSDCCLWGAVVRVIQVSRLVFLSSCGMVWVGFVRACSIFFNFASSWFDLLCIDALNIHATHIACVRMFFNANYISVCCGDNVVESSDLINCLSFFGCVPSLTAP